MSDDLSFLSSITLYASDDMVKRDLEVTCTRCGAHLCDAEHGDSLAVLVNVAKEHHPVCGTIDDLPPDHVCEECGEGIHADESPGVWLHDSGNDTDADHVARPEKP